MTIDDIRKKLKQQQDYRANKVAEYRATLPQQQTSTWNAVQNRMNNQTQVKSKGNLFSDVGKALANLGLGAKKSFESSAYYIDKISDVTGNKAKEDARLNQLKQIREAKTLQDRINLQLGNIQEINTDKPNLIKRNVDSESAVEKVSKKLMEEDEQKIAENIESTSNKVARKVAELTPSIRTICNRYGIICCKSSVTELLIGKLLLEAII